MLLKKLALKFRIPDSQFKFKWVLWSWAKTIMKDWDSSVRTGIRGDCDAILQITDCRKKDGGRTVSPHSGNIHPLVFSFYLNYLVGDQTSWISVPSITTAIPRNVYPALTLSHTPNPAAYLKSPFEYIKRSLISPKEEFSFLPLPSSSHISLLSVVSSIKADVTPFSNQNYHLDSAPALTLSELPQGFVITVSGALQHACNLAAQFCLLAQILIHWLQSPNVFFLSGLYEKNSF